MSTVASYRGKKAKRSDEASPVPDLPVRAEGGFRLVSPFAPAGDQPKAIKELIEGIDRGDDAQEIGRAHV